MNQASDNQLLSLSQAMLESAQASDWEKVSKLEQQRLPLFNQIFEDGVSGKEELAQKVLSFDTQTMELARAGLPIIRDALVRMRDGSNANKAYRTIQRSTLSEK